MTTQGLRPGATVVVFPGRPEARLTASLAKLDAALGAQRRAMESFRRSLDTLEHQFDGLEQGLARYRTKLGTLGMAVSRLQRQAHALCATADRASSRSST